MDTEDSNEKNKQDQVTQKQEKKKIRQVSDFSRAIFYTRRQKSNA